MSAKTYLVLSDSHGQTGRLSTLLMRAEALAKVNGVIHLGDGYADLEPYVAVFPEVIRVKGNCDGYGAPLSETTLAAEVAGVRMLLTHGHPFSVKQGTDTLLLKALRENCRAALFGHTHIPYLKEKNGVLLLNPGAAMDGHFAFLKVFENGALDAALY
ncbi:MAG: YfcE family phosphodiesterase [Clostridia bacterium]|nr:YfcE family phosphodiesterase [Clostridia bacterium]